MSLVHPPSALDRQSLVHVLAPAGPVDATRLDRGIARLGRKLAPGQIRRDESVLERSGYFAGEDSVRVAALRRAFADPEVGAIWCARGGYGVTRILGSLDSAALRDRPRPIIGFSDATALLCWAYTAAGVASVHGPVIGQLSTLAEPDLDRVTDLVRGEPPAPLEATNDPRVSCGGTVEGPLIVGNLEVLRSMIGTPFFPDLDGAILGLEEIGERPYRIDRALTHLLTSGALRGVRGVVVGQLHACEEPAGGGSQGASAADVVSERLGRLGVPVVSGFPFGHDPIRNSALPFGAPVRLVADDATLLFLEWPS